MAQLPAALSREMDPFQEHPAYLSACSLEAASSAVNEGLVQGFISPHRSICSLLSVGCSHWLSCLPATVPIPWVLMWWDLSAAALRADVPHLAESQCSEEALMCARWCERDLQ